MVCDAANPKGDTFPGVEHGLSGHHDIFDINEDHIKALPKDSIAILAFGAICNDFSKLRLLPDRLDYKTTTRDLHGFEVRHWPWRMLARAYSREARAIGRQTA